MQYRKMHYNLKNWVESLDFNIDRLSNFCDNPDNPTMEKDIMEINIYQNLRAFLSGGDHTNFTPEQYDYLIKTWKESQTIKRDFKKEKNSSVPLFVHAPEIVEQEHYEEMLALEQEQEQEQEQKPKKGKKKSSSVLK